jgi:stage V sporulation protein G
MKTNVDIEIADIRKLVGEGNLRGFADVRIGGCFLVRGFSILNGKNGLFVSLPSRQGKDGRWFETLVIDDDSVKRRLFDRILEAYDLEADEVKA